jgi:cyclase
MDEHLHAPDPTVAAGHLVEVAEATYAWIQPDGTWWLNNAGAVAWPDGALVVDTCATEARTRRFLDSLDAATGGVPVRYAVNTHEHGDHTYGNSLLPEGAVLIGHEAMRSRLLRDRLLDRGAVHWAPVPDWGAVTRRVPDVTVATSLRVHAGGRPIEVVHPGGPAHTAGDLVVWLPEDRVLFTGDLLFVGLTPLVFGGSLEGALRALDWVAGFGPDVVVPGHGPVTAAADLAGVLASHERYYRFVLELADDGRSEGIAPLALAEQADLGPFAEWPDAERLVLNLHRAYADADTVPLDLAAALDDAMILNGGPLTTHVCCLA